MAQAVWADSPVDPGPADETLDGAIRGVAVHPPSGRAEEDRAAGPLSQVEIDCSGGARREGDGGVLATLGDDLEGSVTSLVLEISDLCAPELRRSADHLEP